MTEHRMGEADHALLLLVLTRGRSPLHGPARRKLTRPCEARSNTLKRHTCKQLATSKTKYANTQQDLPDR